MKANTRGATADVSKYHRNGCLVHNGSVFFRLSIAREENEEY